MTEAGFSLDCVAPGGQAVLFHVEVIAAPTFRVTDTFGTTHTITKALGVAITVAEHLVGEHGEAWICASDGTTARLDRTATTSDTPDRPWVRSVASIHPRKDTNR